MGGNSIFGYGEIIVLVSLILIYVFNCYLEHKKLIFVTEFTSAILFGLLAAYIFRVFLHAEMNFTDKNFTFFILIPPILFCQGYLIKKRYFFKYFFYISLFGFFGTLFSFILMYIFNSLLNESSIIKTDGHTIQLSTFQVFLFSAIVCSCEPLTVKVFVNQNDHPKLYNILYGEQTLNDIVVFCLVVGTVQTVNENIESESFGWRTYFLLIGIICYQIAITSLIGIVLGLTVTLLTKFCRFILHSDFGTAALIVYFGYLSFTFSKAFNLAGVVSVISCAIIVSHYMVYNISPEAQQLTIQTIKLLASVTEILMAFFLGTMTYSIIFLISSVAWPFVFVELLLLTLTRFLMVFGLSAFVKLVKIKKAESFRLNTYELLFIAFSGLFRGPIVIALIQYIHTPVKPAPTDSIETWEHYWYAYDQVYTITCTAFLIALFTNVIYGSIVQPLSQFCLPKTETLEMFKLTEKKEKDDESDKKSLKKSKTFDDKKKHWFFFFLKNFDRTFMKKYLIYNYEERKTALKTEKHKYKEQQSTVHDGHGNHGEKHHKNHKKGISHSNTEVPHVSHADSLNETMDHNHFIDLSPSEK